jgi:hypothetical protein
MKFRKSQIAFLISSTLPVPAASGSSKAPERPEFDPKGFVDISDSDPM